MSGQGPSSLLLDMSSSSKRDRKVICDGRGPRTPVVVMDRALRVKHNAMMADEGGGVCTNKVSALSKESLRMVPTYERHTTLPPARSYTGTQ